MASAADEHSPTMRTSGSLCNRTQSFSRASTSSSTMSVSIVCIPTPRCSSTFRPRRRPTRHLRGLSGFHLPAKDHSFGTSPTLPTVPSPRAGMNTMCAFRRTMTAFVIDHLRKPAEIVHFGRANYAGIRGLSAGIPRTGANVPTALAFSPVPLMLVPIALSPGCRLWVGIV